MDSFPAQLKQVFRRLARAPMFTFVAVLTLALGIGANTAIFSVLEGVLLKALPYPDPDRLIGLWMTAPGVKIKDLNMDAATYFVVKENNRSFSNLGVYTDNRVSVTGSGEPEQVPSLLVTYGLLPTLEVRPLLGRVFSAKDDSPGSPATAILCYGYWQRHFGGNPNVLGQRLRVDGRAEEVIGVLPKDFRFLDTQVDLIEPFQFDRSKTTLGNFSYEAVGRLKPGVTLAQAQADAARMLPLVSRTFPPPPGFSAKLFEQARIAPTFRPFKQDLTGDIGPMLWVLMGTIGVVLLIACANVANLVLVRVESRHLELTVRSALGASTGRIAFELLLESLTVAVLGGLAGLALAFGGLRILVALAPAGIPRIEQVGIDAPVMLFALAVSLLTGLLFGSAPVLKYASASLAAGIREGSRSLSISRERHRARNTLVVVQVALALVLLISSGLMIRTFLALTHVQPGFRNAAELQTLRIAINDTQVPEPEKVFQMEREITQRLQQIPGVTSVALTSSLPMGGNTSMDLVFARDHVYGEGQLPPLRRFIFSSPGLPATLGSRLLAGRDFTWTDTAEKRPVAIISEGFAKDYWGSPQAALHQQIREGMNDDWREIIGVVGAVHYDGVDKPVPTAVYFPLFMNNMYGEKTFVQRYISFVVRSPRAGSESLLNEIRRAVWAVDPSLPVARVRTLEQLYKKSLARTSFTLVLLMISAGMALLLGAVGIYGVIAYSVAQRTREIGIRMALGAQRDAVAGMFVRHGLLLAAIGSAFGLAGASLLMRLLSTLLFGVNAIDPLTYGATLIILLLIAGLASYLPSRRAAAVDPSAALRRD